MKPSDMVWKYLEEEEMTTRGDAQEVFAEALLVVLDGHEDDSTSDGTVIDALKTALNVICDEDDARFYLLAEYLNTPDDEDDLEEDE